mmetsp:Transcript_24313/g.73033  ORF Transcript_24313/g.73033 Transcript_24313/m.73033 type:complete len:239 (+) Transcript_24313:503-1219(+)
MPRRSSASKAFREPTAAAMCAAFSPKEFCVAWLLIDRPGVRQTVCTASTSSEIAASRIRTPAVIRRNFSDKRSQLRWSSPASAARAVHAEYSARRSPSYLHVQSSMRTLLSSWAILALTTPRMRLPFGNGVRQDMAPCGHAMYTPLPIRPAKSKVTILHRRHICWASELKTHTSDSHWPNAFAKLMFAKSAVNSSLSCNLREKLSKNNGVVSASCMASAHHSSDCMISRNDCAFALSM